MDQAVVPNLMDSIPFCVKLKYSLHEVKKGSNQRINSQVLSTVQGAVGVI